tara:strand:- start:412 stop:3780 length:3369 start_codon:yes stop_codon:yes gene_type:complete
MDLMSENAVAALGLLVAEAAERLVDEHDQSLDKRAALMKIESPTFQNIDNVLRFEFRVKGNRQPEVTSAIEISPDVEPEGEEEYTPLGTSLTAVPSCSCGVQPSDSKCSHTLAISWWLQEQLGRRSISDVFEFFSELKVDTLAAGRELVAEILNLAEQSTQPAEAEQPTQLQWRIRLSTSTYYSPIAITAYEQRPRKNGKGWTKGREVRSYDLLKRDFSANPVDGRVAALSSTSSYSFEDEYFTEFQAIEQLVGHPNVTWDDADATPIEVYSSELTLGLTPVEVDTDESEPTSGSNVDVEAEPTDELTTRYRPELRLAGFKMDPTTCNVILGYRSPSDPVVVLADRKQNRLFVCPLRDARATKLIQHLFRSDLDDTILDAETAAKLAVSSIVVDSLVRVELPNELAGPIEPISAELVLELLPRPGAGLHISLAMHDERFRETLRPGQSPETVACLTETGPVRLQRDLEAETLAADRAIERFEFQRLIAEGHFQWIAPSDESALDLLARLYNAGDEAPRMIWPEGETIRVRGEITPSSLKVQIDDKRDWFGLTGSVEIDGQHVPLADLLEAVRQKRSLVQVGDREFAKISESFRRRLEQLGDTVVAEKDAFRVADAAVPAVQELIGVDVPLEATARWHESLQRLESLADWTPEKPEALDAELRDYQLDGFQWLARLSQWGVGGVLADDMGLGKTVQALGVLVERADDGPALVVAPTSVGDNWVRETERFAPSLRPLLYRDHDRDQLIKDAVAGDLIIVSYQLLQRDAKRFGSREWNTLVLDEAQFIKNAQTKTSQAVRAIDAQWRIGLSGTPLENHLGELWSLFRTLSPGLLGSWERFRTRFADPIERHKDPTSRESLARLVRPFILRRTKDKVLKELPPRTEITLQAELSKQERKLYEDVRLAAVTELSGTAEGQHAGEQRIRTLAWLTKLRQLACHPRLVDTGWKKSSAKLDLLVSLVEELREGDHRALVFSQFVKHLSVIRETFDAKGISYQYLDGSTPAKERQRRVDAFQNGEGDLFLISLKAGGTGLNLTAADYVIHLDPWWNPAVEDQATDRAHRIGQDRPVTVYRLVAQGTIEEQILQLHADKRELVAGVLDGTDRAAKMNTEDLIQLIKEGATAV